jgi:hypothetical protein
MVPYCDELTEEGLDKEDTVTEAEAVEVTVASTLLLAVTPVDLKGPGAPAGNKGVGVSVELTSAVIGENGVLRGR